MAICLNCLAGYPWECLKPDVNGYASCCAVENKESPIRIGPVKDNSEVTDLESTGRKRAAELYPLTEGMICEWAGLKFAGGGIVPIIGCNSNLATNRHHGPDKNTLNNSSDNLHRICSTCHNRWHTNNDGYYPNTRPSGDIPFIPVGEYKKHDSETKASHQEIIESELKWRTKKK